MIISSSDFLHLKKPITNVSARVTLNPNLNSEGQPNNKSFNTPNFFRYKTFNIANAKNIQSYSASALPNLDKSQPVINCEFNPPHRFDKNINHPYMIKIDESRPDRTKSLAKDSERVRYQQRILAKSNKKFSLKYQCYFPLHHKSSTHIQMKSFRHTVQPNQNHELPKHKQPDWVQKMQSYWKTIKLPKQNQELKVKFKQTQEQLKLGVNSQRFPDFKDNNLNKSIKYDIKGKLIFRQTLQPQVQRNIWEPKSINNNNTATFFKQKGTQKEKSLNKPQKSRKSDFKNMNHHISHPNIFWKNKAVSPPSKPWSPQKVIQQKQYIPPLPIKTNQKSTTHRPSFILNKKSLSRFSIMKQLGSGAYTDAFLCMDKKIGAIFCLKRYHKATIRNFPQVLQTFIKKFAFQFLAQHPNIIQLYDIFCDGQFVYTIEQYMQGGKLSDLLRQQIEQRQQKRRQTKRLDLDIKQSQQILLNDSKIIDRVFDINSALCYIHQSCDTVVKVNSRKIPPLVHGDVRIKSILVNMGVCKLPTIEPLHTKSHYINSYSSPEQIIQQVYLPQSDIWSLGLVLFELCAEKKLFGSSQISQDLQQVSKPGYHVFNVNIIEQIQKLPSTTQTLKQLIKKLLTVQPEQRPTSDIVMLSNIFQTYGFDVEWKERRNCKLIKQSQLAKINLKTKSMYLKKSIQQEQIMKDQAQWQSKTQNSTIQAQTNVGKNNESLQIETPVKFLMKGKNHLHGFKNNDFHYK